jgi:predicted Holliday junction resolvase-like endonuclease
LYCSQEDFKRIQGEIASREREFEVRLKMEAAKLEATERQLSEMQRLADEEKLKQQEAHHAELIALQQEKEISLRRVSHSLTLVGIAYIADAARAERKRRAPPR